LNARLFLRGDQVEAVRPGSEVWVNVKSFPAKDFGIFEAKVTSITNINDSGTETDEKSQTFVAEIMLVEKPLTVFGRQAFLTHGMTLTAEVISERLTLLEWLFEPIFLRLRKLPAE
jgi:membrane fusion protein